MILNLFVVNIVLVYKRREILLEDNFIGAIEESNKK